MGLLLLSTMLYPCRKGERGAGTTYAQPVKLATPEKAMSYSQNLKWRTLFVRRVLSGRWLDKQNKVSIICVVTVYAGLSWWGRFRNTPSFHAPTGLVPKKAKV